MRAVFIDPNSEKVTEVELDSKNPVSTVIQLLGGGSRNVVLGALIFNEDNGDALYVNANNSGLGRPRLQEIWTYLGQPFRGPGVIVGRNFLEDAEVPLSRATDRTRWSECVPEEFRSLFSTH